MIRLNESMARVVSINISKGGIPKNPVASAYIKEGGLEGDGHNHEKHYRPIQAVSLQDVEKLDELRAEGYPLYPGATGENVTVSGLNINELPLGTRLEFSGGVVIELSKVRQPCYVLDSINPRLKEDILGRCGYYAKVIIPGQLSVGETIQIKNSGAQLSITGAIFCGGNSSRMGVPKAGILLSNGKTMVEHVYAALSQVCTKVVLVGHAEGVPEPLKDLPRIRDRYSDCGPLGALEALLSSGLNEEYLIAPCDLPWISPEVFQFLLAEGVNAPAILMRGDVAEPLIGRYSIDQLAHVRQLIQERKLAMRQLVDSVQARKIALPERYHFTIHNANRKEDLTLMLPQY